MKFTPGPWEAVRMATNHEVQAANGVLVVADVYSAGVGTHEANAHLIAAAVNVCAAVNPENPMAVAESIKEMLGTLKLTAKLMKGLARIGIASADVTMLENTVTAIIAKVESH